MDFFLGLDDDLGYGSGEESDGQHEREWPEQQPPPETTRASIVDRDIALYDQKQIAEVEKAQGWSTPKYSQTMTFFPPRSSDNPRTSLQFQRQEEYSKPIYLLNEDFRRISLVRNNPHRVNGQRVTGSEAGSSSSRGTSSPSQTSHGQPRTSKAPTLLRSAAKAGSTSSSPDAHHSAYLTPVQRQILSIVQIPERDNRTNESAPSADGEENKRKKGKVDSEVNQGREGRKLSEGKGSSYDERMTASEDNGKGKLQSQKKRTKDSFLKHLMNPRIKRASGEKVSTQH